MALSSFHGGHSRYGGGKDEVREIAEAAAAKGFVAFGFTEHFETPPMALKPDMALHGRLDVFDQYVADVRAAQLLSRLPPPRLLLITGFECSQRYDGREVICITGGACSPRVEEDDIRSDLDKPKSSAGP